MTKQKKLAFFSIAVVAVVALLYPWKTTVVPEWKLQVVDVNGVPIGRIGVRQVWQHYDIESQGHREDRTTDDNGYVSFPERTARGPLVVRMVRAVINRFPHQSSGADAFLVVLSSEYDTWRNNSAVPGQPLPKQMVVVKKNR
jgi:hypothetical protein